MAQYLGSLLQTFIRKGEAGTGIEDVDLPRQAPPGNDSVTLPALFYGGLSPVPAEIFVLIKVGKIETILVRCDPNKSNHLAFAQPP